MQYHNWVTQQPILQFNFAWSPPHAAGAGGNGGAGKANTGSALVQQVLTFSTQTGSLGTARNHSLSAQEESDAKATPNKARRENLWGAKQAGVHEGGINQGSDGYDRDDGSDEDDEVTSPPLSTRLKRIASAKLMAPHKRSPNFAGMDRFQAQLHAAVTHAIEDSGEGEDLDAGDKAVTESCGERTDTEGAAGRSGGKGAAGAQAGAKTRSASKRARPSTAPASTGMDTHAMDMDNNTATLGGDQQVREPSNTEAQEERGKVTPTAGERSVRQTRSAPSTPPYQRSHGKVGARVTPRGAAAAAGMALGGITEDGVPYSQVAECGAANVEVIALVSQAGLGSQGSELGGGSESQVSSARKRRAPDYRDGHAEGAAGTGTAAGHGGSGAAGGPAAAAAGGSGGLWGPQAAVVGSQDSNSSGLTPTPTGSPSDKEGEGADKDASQDIDGSDRAEKTRLLQAGAHPGAGLVATARRVVVRAQALAADTSMATSDSVGPSLGSQASLVRRTGAMQLSDSALASKAASDPTGGAAKAGRPPKRPKTLTPLPAAGGGALTTLAEEGVVAVGGEIVAVGHGYEMDIEAVEHRVRAEVEAAWEARLEEQLQQVRNV